MRKQDSDYILARLANLSNSAEGATLPPQLSQGQRIPSVTSPFIARTESVTGGTNFYLVFNEPPGKNLYAFYWKIQSTETNNISQFSGPQTSSSSPIVIFVAAPAGKNVTFYIQTQASGLNIPIDSSPTCTSVTI
jgi:hypothetical protein